MKLIKRLLLLTYLMILSIIIISCKKNNIRNQNQIDVIDIKENIKNFKFINLSEITDNINYVTLETDSNSLFKYIIDIISLNDRFVIMGPFSCKVFNDDGKFICNIGSRGAGPGQYYSVKDISIDRKNQNLFLSDGSQFLEYSIEGRFIKEIKIPDNVKVSGGLLNLGNNKYCGLNIRIDEPNSMYIFNDQNKILKTFPNLYYDTLIHKTNRRLYVSLSPDLYINNRVLYKNYLCDTVYSLTNEMELKPAYWFNFEEYDNALKFVETAPDKGKDDRIEDYLSIQGIKETRHFLFFYCDFGKYLPKSEYVEVNIQQPEGAWITRFPGDRIGGFFNRETGQLVFLRKNKEYQKQIGGFSGFLNDIDGGVPFWPWAQPYENKLVSFVDAYELKEYVQSDAFKNSKPKYPEKKKALKELADSLGWEDNPVLMVVTLKE